jgi:outer membrane protein OmpA-like peptidoglycan-associated protein
MKYLLVWIVWGCTAFLCPLMAQKLPVLSAQPGRSDVYQFADTARLREKQWEIGVALGHLLYLGDVSNDSKYGIRTFEPMYGIFTRRYVSPVIALRLQAMHGILQESDIHNANRTFRGFSFKTPVTEIMLRGEWDIFGKKRFRRVDTSTYTLNKYHQYALINVFRHNLLPYIFAGAGGVMTNPKADFNASSAEGTVLEAILADKEAGKGLKIRPGFQFGGGWNFEMSRRWILGVEVGARTSFTDYFDGISLAANPLKNDWYWFGGVSVSRRLGTPDTDGDGIPDHKDRCPRVPGRGITQGCPDADGDRIADREDECPHKPGVPAMSGCPFRGFAGNDSLPEEEIRRIAGFNTLPDENYFTKNDLLNFADSARTWDRRAELGLLAGHLHYLGDLANDGPLGFRQIHPGVGLYLRKPLAPRLALRFQGLYGTIRDEDRYNKSRDSRGFSFSTRITELSGQLEWDFFGKKRYQKTDTITYTLDKYRQKAVVRTFKPTLSPYIFVGGGALLTDVTSVYPQEVLNNNAVKTDRNKVQGTKTAPLLIVGSGITLDLNQNWTLGGTLGARTAFNDYLDGVSQSGNPKQNDWYWFTGITLGKRLGQADRDGDGTPDRRDACPDTPGRPTTKGCPDADADGIADREDQCPQRPGLAVKAGCPLTDTDNDSIPDLNDKCPEVAGIAQFDGCPDSDGDGVEDVLDACRLIPGPVSMRGCPDSDGDGVEDNKDLCPDKAGAATFNGCPDADGDGVEDSKDPCPDKAGPSALDGCPDSDSDGVADIKDPCPDKAGKPEWGGCNDSDGDGINDGVDECPTKPGKPEWNGCPDTDGDGVSDNKDVCPLEKGKPENKGCPNTDKDKDGIADALDECPTVKGKKEFNGCPDADGDGIEDRKDACPNGSGKPEFGGCPDTDGDGISDNKDACPSLAGKPEYRGCPDTDGDGIGDGDDLCPERAGTAENKGCPTVEEKDREQLEIAISKVQFETAKAVLKPESHAILNNIVDIVQKYKGYHVNIEGHTDNTGGEKSNQILSEKRAKACVDYLTKKGVAQAKMHAKGYGESKPIADNTTTEGQAQNRRVELKLFLPK